MKIQLKRSSVVNNGVAKEPTAPQMEFGELAVNYNVDDPAIFIKDSNQNIIRIAGYKNISWDGNTEIPSGPTPPADPVPGNFWYNPEDGRLYYYYKDPDSEQWVDASPDNWQGAGTLPDVDNPASQPGTLDDRYVNIPGDNMTGNLTLGTNKITLNATDGSATFAEEKLKISEAGSGSVSLGTVDWSNKTGVGVYQAGGGRIAVVNGASGSTAFSVGFNDQETIKFLGDGTAEFDGDLFFNGPSAGGSNNIYNTRFNVLQNGGNVTRERFVSNGVVVGEIRSGQYFSNTGDSGFLFYTSDSDGSVDNGTTATCRIGHTQVDIGNTLPSAPNITLKTDGSAEFAAGGTVIYGTDAPGTIKLGETTGTTYGGISMYRSDQTNTGTFLRCFSGASRQKVVEINEEGSAEFAGSVKLGKYDANNETVGGIQLAYNSSNERSAVSIQGRSTTDTAAAAFVIRRGKTEAYKITYGGAAAFSNVTFNLEADDDTKYTSTTDADGNETLVYNGATLDVKDRLQKADAALLALKTAAASATDFASLQSAIVTALADI